jgi:hypothetical protein
MEAPRIENLLPDRNLEIYAGQEYQEIERIDYLEPSV